MTKQNSSESAPGLPNPGIPSPLLTGAAGLEALANAVTQLEQPTLQETIAPATPAAEAGPDGAPAPAEGDAPGQDNLPPEETPSTSPEGGGGEPETDLSQNADLAGLDADTRKYVLELAAAVKAGELKPGELPRIAKLVGKAHEAEERATAAAQAKIDELQTQIDQLKAGAAELEPAAAMPPGLSKIKTVAEVERREIELGGLIEQGEDWLFDNPNGGLLGNSERKPEEIRAKLKEFKAELRWLPKRGRELAQQAEFTVSQQRAKSALVQRLPHLADPGNAETTAMRAVLTENPWIKNLPAPELHALLLVRGAKALEADLKPKAAGGGVTGGHRPPLQPKPGKPAGGGSASAPAANAGRNVDEAKLRIGKERSLGSLADLVAATE